MREINNYGDGWTITIGGGVSTERILQILRIQWLGGIRKTDGFAEQIKCGEGPLEFVTVYRESVEIGNPKGITIGDLQKEMKNSPMSNEVALRWLIIDPGGIFLNKGQKEILVVTPEPLMINGKMHALFLRAGDEGPILCVWEISPDCKFPTQYDYLTARDIGYGTPFCS